MMRWAGFAALSIILGSGWIAAEEEQTPPEPIGCSVRHEGGVTIHEAILPGDVVDWSLLSEPVAERSLALLVEMEDESRRVFRWSLAGEGQLTEIGPAAPEDAEVLIPDPGGGDRPGGVMLAAGGTVWGLSKQGQWERRLESPYEVFPLRDVRGGRPLVGNEILLRSVGLVQALVANPETQELEVAWRLDLPLTVDREWGGLRLGTPPLNLFEFSPAGQGLLILGPEPHGKRRIKSLLLEFSTGEVPEALESWNMLPTPEDIDESWYVVFDGGPALIVTSLLAEQHGVFEKKKLRLFELKADRTRSGAGPLLEVVTRTRNWYGTCAGIADLNGDGLDDVVAAQPKGLGGGSLWVEGFLARPEGGFEEKSRGSELEVEEGEICTLAADVDGDGHVDLVVIEDDSLLVFNLIRQAASKAVVDDHPQWRISFHDLRGRPVPVEIQGFAATQILVTGHTEGKRQAIRVLRFH